MEKLKVGMVGTYQLNFQGDKIGVLRKSIREMEELAKKKGFDFFPIRKGVVTEADAEKARKELDDHNVDLVLIQNSSFSAGDIISHLARVRGRMGLWAVPETTDSGPLPLNSFCGMNMYSSIIGQYLKEEGIPFKWFFGNINGEFFGPRFDVTLKVLQTIKTLSKARIGLIGGIAPGFNDLYYDERKIEAKLGVRIYGLHEFSEVIQKAERFEEKRVVELIKIMKAEAVAVKVSDKRMEKAARVYLALEQIAQNNGYAGLAVSCWPKFQTEYQLAICSSLGRLNENGIVAACEGDVVSAVSMLILNYLNGDQSTMLDLVAFDESDQTVQMFHCGPSAKRWANSRGVILDSHSVLGIERPGQPIVRDDMGVINDMIFKPVPVTILRLTWEGEYMLQLTAEILQTKKWSFDGSRGWFGKLRMNGESISIEDLLNTIMVQRFQHHYPVGIGHLNDELMEFGVWLEIKPLERVPYQRYLQQPCLDKR